MKVTILSSASRDKTGNLVERLGSHSPILMDAGDDGQPDEYEYIKACMIGVPTSLLIIRFSGCHNVLRDIGDETPEMVIPLDNSLIDKQSTIDLINLILKGE